VSVPFGYEAETNVAVTQAASVHPGVVFVADWHAAVAAHPSYVGPDHVHPNTPAGWQAFADTVAGAVAKVPVQQAKVTATVTSSVTMGPSKPGDHHYTQAQMQAAVAKYDPAQAQDLGAIAMAETAGRDFPTTNPTGRYHGPWAFQEAANPQLNFNMLDGSLDYAAKAAADLARSGITHGKWETWPAMAAKFLPGGSQAGAAAQPAVPAPGVVLAAATSPACPSGSASTTAFDLPGGGSGDLVKTGEAIVAAFRQCQAGSTYLGNDACVNGSLRGAGYTAAQVAQFDQRRAGSADSVGCTECLGFQSLAITLAYGDANPLPVGEAMDVLGRPSWSFGGVTYARIPAGAPPKPGDLGYALPGPGDGGGNHALIVKTVRSDGTFVAVEGNFRRCTATDDIAHGTATYAYYRKR